MAPETIENVIIVGSGPAGYTAALYTARANLEPLVIEGFMWGGLLQQTTDVENFPGYPQGVMGPQMMQDLRDQAERFGTRFITDNATRVIPGAPGEPHEVHVHEDVYKARTVVLSMGAEHKKLGVPGEDELAGRGVSYCATCDAAFFKDRPTIIVGGGDSAMEEAIFLAKFSDKVAIVHRRDEFRASKIMLERARSTPNIEFMTPYVVEAFLPGENGALDRARLRQVHSEEIVELPIAGAFIAVGHEPQSEIVDGIVDIDDNGYVITEGKSTRTNVAGIFAAGDLVDHTYRQAITAAGSGCQAALDAEWYLRDNPLVPTPAALEGTADLAEAQWAPAAGSTP
ncbi:MAG: thioredoxin reductase [Solirubrobacteraceae bacterium]|jgi:thioredoxin reductase (NADPH)|nr:thioredoxin reductase [Solirubrobacteraceae bacterium]